MLLRGQPQAPSSGTRDAWDQSARQSGRFPGIPARRGKRPGQAVRWTRTIRRGGPVRRCSTSRPSSVNGSGGQRAEAGSGGSLTTRWPPSPRRGAAHSAVTAGDAKLRATTTSKWPRSSSWRPRSSARACRGSMRAAHPKWSTAQARKSTRRRCASTSTTCAVGQASTPRTRPGRPPPLPRSATRSGTASSAPAKASAWSICWSRGAEPRSRRCCASASTSSS